MNEAIGAVVRGLIINGLGALINAHRLGTGFVKLLHARLSIEPKRSVYALVSSSCSKRWQVVWIRVLGKRHEYLFQSCLREKIRLNVEQVFVCFQNGEHFGDCLNLVAGLLDDAELL